MNDSGPFDPGEPSRCTNQRLDPIPNFPEAAVQIFK